MSDSRPFVCVAPFVRIPQYRDRAGERRKLYGQSKRPKGIRKSGPSEPAHVRERRQQERMKKKEVAAAAAAAAKPLDSSNVGNRLLRKMGWVSGEGLGRDKQGIKAPVDAIAGMGGQSAATRTGVGAAPRGLMDPNDSFATRARKSVRGVCCMSVSGLS